MAAKAIGIMLDPARLSFLALGVVIGLGLGVIPGLGGIVGMALLLPFTFDIDPFSAFALLLGMGSVTTTSDTIPAVLFGVPGTTGSAATILDGHPLARQGQAGRAFGAAYTASLIGGLFGALLLAVSIPLLRPVMLHIGSPELLAFAVFGLCMVSAVSVGTPLRGLTIAGFGVMLAMIGADPQSGTQRWSLGSLYLWDGLSLVPVTLGLFALPELADMAIERRSIARKATIDSRSGQWHGVKDTFKNWWLVIRVAWLGSTLGAVPGIGAAVIDWIAYGHAARTEKGASETFGQGDIRGVLASEGANNAKEGGALVPTIAFGVPGSASMAILLGAFLIHGLQPGPDMLTRNLDVTYTMVWSVALANILGAGICFAFSNQFAKIALIRASILTPLVLAIILVGAFQGSRQWGDLITLVGFGILGWSMKRLEWPRPPLILGFVLGGIVERYLFISVDRYGADWLLNPIVIALFVLSVWGFVRPFRRQVKAAGGAAALFAGYSRARYDANSVFYAGLIFLMGAMAVAAAPWNFMAKLVPLIVGCVSIAIAVISLLNHTFRGSLPPVAKEDAESRATETLPLDTKAASAVLGRRVIARRATGFLVWLIVFLIMVALFGMLPAIFLFIVLYMRIDGGERWAHSLPLSAAMTVFAYLLFDQLLSLPWPETVLGGAFPQLKALIPSL